MRAGRRKGGERNRQPLAVLAFSTPTDTDTDPGAPDLSTAAAIAKYLGYVISQTITGKVDHRVANSVGMLAGQLLRALDAAFADERLDEIEARLTHHERRGTA
jgi:hypothetical protein